MITPRPASERGMTKLDWLLSYHSFSFADYLDSRFMGFKTLRVINEDFIQPGAGFGLHSHRHMEILTFVVEGALAHKDSMGNHSIIMPGEIQRMSAGTGIQHSEFNHSDSALLHLLQIWIIPDRRDLKPAYQQKSFHDFPNQWILLASEAEGKQSVKINQNVKLFVAFQDKDLSFDLKLQPAWLQLVKGGISLNEQALQAGDGAAIMDEETLEVKCLEKSLLLLFVFEDPLY